jgi:hypothetical protein
MADLSAFREFFLSQCSSRSHLHDVPSKNLMRLRHFGIMANEIDRKYDL